MGAGFAACNIRCVAPLRARLAPEALPTRRLAEVLVLAGLNALCKFGASVLLGRCSPKPDSPYRDQLVALYCPPGEYNDVASLALIAPEEGLRLLFHFGCSPGANATTPGPAPGPFTAFSGLGLGAYFLFYAASAVLTYGAAIPAGLFIPALLSGGLLGRLIGQFAGSLAPVGGVVSKQ